MTKKIISGIAVVTIALTMALNLNFSTKSADLSDISLANVEALARGEAWYDIWDVYHLNAYAGCGFNCVYVITSASFCVEGGYEQCY